MLGAKRGFKGGLSGLSLTSASLRQMVGVGFTKWCVFSSSVSDVSLVGDVIGRNADDPSDQRNWLGLVAMVTDDDDVEAPPTVVVETDDDVEAPPTKC